MAEYDNSELMQQALLYAAGEMDPLAAAAFESLLEKDSLAQDALTQVVQLNLLMEGRDSVPSAAYRDVVRKKTLRQNRRQQRMLAILGFCAASVALSGFLGIGRNQKMPKVEVANPPSQVEQLSASTEPVIEEEPVKPAQQLLAMDTALAWAEMSNSDHLHRALDDEHRHKVRVLRKDDLGHHRPWMQLSRSSP